MELENKDIENKDIKIQRYKIREQRYREQRYKDIEIWNQRMEILRIDIDKGSMR